ncbi:hypothetical protein ACRC6Q_18925 [Planococcus sp. SE5232]|uniref:hypothetical protein n=1 Tax=unclassified Planococcus (in: firmicutes) TaxID=2662419 RepID=UPI003D6B77A4
MKKKLITLLFVFSLVLGIFAVSGEEASAARADVVVQSHLINYETMNKFNYAYKTLYFNTGYTSSFKDTKYSGTSIYQRTFTYYTY